jgi:hypothetical protein
LVAASPCFLGEDVTEIYLAESASEEIASELKSRDRARRIFHKNLWITLICLGNSQTLDGLVFVSFLATGESFADAFDRLIWLGVLHTWPLAWLAFVAFLCRNRDGISLTILAFAIFSGARILFLSFAKIQGVVTGIIFPPPDGILHREGIFMHIQTAGSWISFIDSFFFMPLYLFSVVIISLVCLILLGLSVRRQKNNRSHSHSISDH